LAFVPLARAEVPAGRCPDGSSFAAASSITRTIAGLTLKLWKDGLAAAPLCHFQVTSAGGEAVASGADAQVEALPEMYVVRNGTNDLILETFSGGAHCCWTYYILTAQPQPRIAAKIQNQRPITFLDFRGIELHDLVAEDGAFDGFDGLAHAASPFPTVYLRFVRGQLRDVGSLFRGEYDREADLARSQITPELRFEFLQRKSSPPYKGANDVTAANVLRIVLAYLYSGRETEARVALGQMWPAADAERVWKLILDTRSRGILHYTAGD
jgi:hypothetical protein